MDRQCNLQRLHLALVFAVYLGPLAMATAAEIDVGTHVMPRWGDVELKIDTQLIGKAIDLLWPMTVEIANDDYLWVKSDEARGWVRRDEVLALSAAMNTYTSQISAILKPAKVEELYVLRGDCHESHAAYQAAIADYTEALKRGVKTARVYRSRAKLHGRIHQYELALADCDAALAIAPTSAPAFCLRGWCRNGLGQHDQAIADFNQALKLNPRLADAFMYRGYAALGKHDPKQAISDMTQAIRIEPTAEHFHGRAVCYSTLQDFPAAAVDLENGLRVDPNHAELHGLRATVYAAQGRGLTAGPGKR